LKAFMNRPGLSICVALLVAVHSPVWSQTAPTPQQISLSASGHVEAPQDWLSVRLGLTREAADAQTVQTQLKAAIDAALASARTRARSGQLEVRSGQFSVSPRYGRDGKIGGWQGSADIVLEGRDVALITATAGRLAPLTVTSMGFSLSREARRQLESQVQAQAIERFRARAAEAR
jgi:predicted secreted protein